MCIKNMCTNINVTREKKVIVYSNETVSTIRVDDSDLQQQCCVYFVHAGKYFPNLIKSNRNQIIFTIFRLIWNILVPNAVRLVPNQLENGKFNIISVRFNKISKRFFCVCIMYLLFYQRYPSLYNCECL